MSDEPPRFEEALLELRAMIRTVGSRPTRRPLDDDAPDLP